VVVQDKLRLILCRFRLAQNNETIRFFFNDMLGKALDDNWVAAAMRDILGYETIFLGGY
jgi:hypothetical protein